jgi:hypothetical protein
MQPGHFFVRTPYWFEKSKLPDADVADDTEAESSFLADIDPLQKYRNCKRIDSTQNLEADL